MNPSVSSRRDTSVDSWASQSIVGSSRWPGRGDQSRSVARVMPANSSSMLDTAVRRWRFCAIVSPFGEPQVAQGPTVNRLDESMLRPPPGSWCRRAHGESGCARRLQDRRGPATLPRVQRPEAGQIPPSLLLSLQPITTCCTGDRRRVRGTVRSGSRRHRALQIGAQNVGAAREIVERLEGGTTGSRHASPAGCWS